MFKKKIPSGLVPVTLTLNGVKINKHIPTGWEYVTYGQMLEVTQAGSDWNKVVSIFTGIDADTLKSSEIKGVHLILELLKFISAPKIEYYLPKTILGYEVKDNLEVENVARYQDLENILRGFSETDQLANLRLYPLIVATYVVKPYDYKDAESLAPAFLDAPAMEVLAIGNFMQMNMRGLKYLIPLLFPRVDTHLNRLLRVMKGFLSRLAFMARYYSWRKTLPTSVQNYLNGR